MNKHYASVWHLLLVMIISQLASAQSPDWKVFTTDNSGIPHNNCHFITFSPEGHPWIGSSDGLGVYKDSAWNSLYLPDIGDFPNWISSIAFDADSQLWVGTYFNGLSSWDGQKWTPQYEGSINALLMTAQQQLWAATNNGVIKLLDSSWMVFDGSYAGMPSPHIKSITLDKSNHIWISSHPHTNFMGGIGRYNGQIWERYNHSHGLPSNFVNEAAFDLANNLWIATEDGIAVKKGNTWITYKTSNSDLPHNKVNTLKVSTAGHIWIGTEKGAAVWNGSDWFTFDVSNSDLPDNRVRHLEIDSKGNIWFATGGGIAVYSGPRTATTLSPLSEVGIRVKNPFPIPVRAGDNLHLEINTEQSAHMDLLLMDMNGRLVQSGTFKTHGTGSDLKEWPVSRSISSGQYLLQIRYKERAESFSVQILPPE